MTRVMNALGPQFRHTIVAMDGVFEALAAFHPETSYRTIPAPPKGASSTPALYRLIRSASPDLVLTYNWGAIESVLAAQLARIPVIHSESGFQPDEAIALKRRRVLARRILLRRVHATVVNSRNLHDIALRNYKLPPANIRLIRNGIDTAGFVPGRNQKLRAELGCEASTFLVGAISRLRTEKNLPLLVHAFAQAAIPNSRLALVGEGPCRSEIEAAIAKHGVTGRVVLCGDAHQTAPYYQAFDLFALSSITEQTPNALLEAMSCGLPAVSTDVGDVKHIVGVEGLPFVAPSNDGTALANAMRILAADSALRTRLGTRNRRHCLEDYSTSRMVGEFDDLYRGALEN